MEETNREQCPVCGGLGRINCPEPACSKTGWHTCKRCRGSGMIGPEYMPRKFS